MVSAAGDPDRPGEAGGTRPGPPLRPWGSCGAGSRRLRPGRSAGLSLSPTPPRAPAPGCGARKTTGRWCSSTRQPPRSPPEPRAAAHPQRPAPTDPERQAGPDPAAGPGAAARLNGRLTYAELQGARCEAVVTPLLRRPVGCLVGDANGLDRGAVEGDREPGRARTRRRLGDRHVVNADLGAGVRGRVGGVGVHGSGLANTDYVGGEWVGVLLRAVERAAGAVGVAGDHVDAPIPTSGCCVVRPHPWHRAAGQPSLGAGAEGLDRVRRSVDPVAVERGCGCAA